jgi:L-serine dehydratase
MRQPASIFNDVIGPVMVGPSSSHTAASARIGYLLRCLCRNQPEEVVCEFSRSGSLAFCHEGQGTDMGLAGGLLGMTPEDERMPQAVELARQAGLELRFMVTDERFAHPNTYRLRVKGGGRQFLALFVSGGGGMIELQRINGIPLSIGGGYYETLFLLKDCGKEEAQQALRGLSALLAGYDEIRLAANGAGNFIINVKSTRQLDIEARGEKIESEASRDKDGLLAFESEAGGEKIFPFEFVADIWQLPPVLPIQSFKHYAGLFNTAAALEALAQADNLSLAQLALLYEARRGHITQAEVFGRMRLLLLVMRQAIVKAENRPHYADRLLPPQAHLLENAPLLPNQTLNTVIRRITLLMEAKSALLPIVAAPSAGSCATLPGTIIGAAEILGKSEKETVEALLAAGLLGVLIAEHATFAAEVGGCQAECGAASGMAAAGLVQLMGGSAQTALNAASLALQNVFGLVCDPVAARVEAPCLGRNIMAGANALAMAQAALAGFDPLIPLDETIAALHKVGQKIDASLRCTCQGGLSATPTARAIETRLNRGQGREDRK